MNYNAKDEVDGGPPCAPGGTAKTPRPDNTAFKQQRLPAWQPILTAGTVLPTFFVIGLIFIPIGIGIFVTSNNICEIEVRCRGSGLLREAVLRSWGFAVCPRVPLLALSTVRNRGTVQRTGRGGAGRR
jgi:hypothetical protein